MTNALGTRIKQLRIEKKISQKKLCEDFLTQPILSYYELKYMHDELLKIRKILDKD